jgi:hypothetical protein
MQMDAQSQDRGCRSECVRDAVAVVDVEIEIEDPGELGLWSSAA